MELDYMNAAEKRILRNLQGSGNIDYFKEDETGRTNPGEEPEDITKFEVAEKLKRLDENNISVYDADGNEIRNSHTAKWKFIGMVNRGDLKEFHEIRVTDWERKYRLNFGCEKITYQIKTRRAV